MASQEQVAHLLQLLQASLSSDASTRGQAEAALAAASTSPGFGTALVAVLLAAGGEVPPGLRQLAATVLKKLVREHWTAEAPQYKGPSVAEEEKAVIREQLPTGLGDESSLVRTAVAMAVAAIARWDCPQHWPGLIPGLVQAITAKKNAHMVNGSVRCLAMFVDEQGDDQIMAISPALMPELLCILRSDEYGPSLQRKALTILHTILEVLQELASGATLADVKQLLGIILPGWLAEFGRLLSKPLDPNDSSSWGLRMEALKCMMLMVTGFSKLCAPHIGSALTAAWQMYTSSLPLYCQLVVDSEDDGEGEQDSEGECVGFDSLISQLLELVLALVGNTRYQALLAASMQQLLHLTLGYMQMTGAQVERWGGDPNLYVADEEDDFSTVRAAGEMLLEECFVAFEGEVVAPLAAAVAARLQEAAAARAAGREDWWKLREAALLAVGTVSDSLIAAAAAGGGRSALDVAGLMGAVLAEDLVPTAPPFLIGRALWVTSRLAPAIPPHQRAAFFQAAVAGLAPGSPPPVQIGACRALATLCQKAKREEVATVAPQMFAGLCRLLQSSTDEILHLVLETLTAALKAAPEAAVQWEPLISEPTLRVWVANVSDPLLSVDSRELLEALAAIPACLPSLQARMLPTLCGILAGPHQHSPILVDGAVELVTLALAPSPPDAAQRIHAAASPAILQLAMGHDDGEVLRSATAYLRTLLQVGGSAALGWPGVPDCLAALLAAVQRLLSPELEDRACSLVGALILELLRHAGPQMAPLLPGLLTALAYKLIAAEDSAMVQSLLCVLAQLLHADQQQLLDCLAGIQLSDGCSALEACMRKWCERQIEVRTAYDIRLTTAALAALLTSSHPALDLIQVKGKRLDTESGVRTRARARAQAEQWSSVPLRVRIVMLLTDAFIEATTQDEASEDDWEEAGGSEEEEQDSEQAGGPSPALGSLRSTMRRFAEAYQEDGGFDAEDLVLSGVDAREAARRAADPIQAIDIPAIVREAFQRVAAARPELMQAGSEQLTPAQLQALQQIFQQQGPAER
ncbi:hypothetical protein D9Q98_002793 [Chlorella vulgaris]|uniref:Importin N-terminal domain-containing protein n=1 Tax=Chlorella vulgaris TaxID=3077 RepID=A0A9D4TU15_CHLVU|nr:hypothetical protein D9Q98_002793 [Chlorella vulgaris]